jgi:GR25 family glycosyltransferase involved in LPS biosynthesis
MNKEKFIDDNLEIFYINLEISKKRREKMEEQFKLTNFKYIRFSAYNGKKITNKFQNCLSKSYKLIDNKGFLFNNKKGSLGNYISQLSCWYNFYKKSSKKYIMVMEDDIVFNGLNKSIIYDILHSLQNENWTMIKFFCFGRNKILGDNYNNFLIKTKVNLNNYKNRQSTGMQCYILNRNKILKLIEDLLPITKHTFDISVKKTMIKHNIFVTKKNYIITPTHNIDSDRKKLDSL